MAQPTTTSREDLVLSAKAAEEAERWTDMSEKVETLAKIDGQELSAEERDLFSKAWKEIISMRRSEWRLVIAKQKAEQNDRAVSITSESRQKIETEIHQICEKVIGLLDQHILPNATSATSKVFFETMKGDFLRYLAEITTGDSKKKKAEDASSAYKEAQTVSSRDLPTTDPLRLKLALSFSVLQYEVLGEPDKACKTAKAAFDDAIRELDQLGEEDYQTSTSTMQLLRDKLTLWTSEEAAAKK